jgi:hypothetical protein
MSWIEQEEKLLKIQHNHPPESMTSMNCFFVYINKNQYIDNIVNECEPVVNGTISKEQVLRIVEQRRHHKPNVRYTFKDACLFLVDLTPDQIPAFSQASPNARFLVKLPLLDDIHIEPSIFVFHDLNALYFLFQEEDAGVRIPLKSIMNSGNRKQKSTKRVSYSNNKTRKNIKT